MKYSKKICLIVTLALIIGTLTAGCGSNRKPEPTVKVDLPAVNSNKHPSQYTWVEYLALNDEQKLEFQKCFGEPKFFEAWKEKAQRGETEVSATIPSSTGETADSQIPWDEPGAKQPRDYTWVEFEALTGSHQIAFQNSFEHFDDFEAWMEKARRGSEQNPWDLEGAKQPDDYTWAEFEALTGSQQIAFQNSFAKFEDFEDWMERVQRDAETYPWEQPGAKQPADYTWAEFEALSGVEQIRFQSSFDTLADFEKWLLENIP